MKQNHTIDDFLKKKNLGKKTESSFLVYVLFQYGLVANDPINKADFNKLFKEYKAESKQQ